MKDKKILKRALTHLKLSRDKVHEVVFNPESEFFCKYLISDIERDLNTLLEKFVMYYDEISETQIVKPKE